jgi:hypothetical protein
MHLIKYLYVNVKRSIFLSQNLDLLGQLSCVVFDVILHCVILRPNNVDIKAYFPLYFVVPINTSYQIDSNNPLHGGCGERAGYP